MSVCLHMMCGVSIRSSGRHMFLMSSHIQLSRESSLSASASLQMIVRRVRIIRFILIMMVGMMFGAKCMLILIEIYE